MKKIFKYAVTCLAVFTMIACGDLYETHEKYLKMGEETYIGRVDTLFANGGFNRIELGWTLNADPRISTCVISWNGCTQPIEVAADRSVDVMKKVIDLPEGKYIFSIVIKSESGKESLVETVSGEVYGTNYQARLAQRGINSMSATPAGVTLKWAPEEGCISSDLTYTNQAGEKKMLTIGEEVSTTFIADFVIGTDFSISSLFKPEKNALDEIRSLERASSFPSYYIVPKAEWDATFHVGYADVDRTGWTVEATTEELTGEVSAGKPHNGQAVSLLDGDLTTFWHSQWSGGAKPPLPHLITFDMKKTQNIISVELARRGGNPDTKSLTFSISDDKESWKELGQLEFPNAADPNAMILLLPKAVSGRYIRTTVTGSNNGVNASIAEILFTSGKK